MQPRRGFPISPSLCIFRKCQSLRHFAKRGIPAQTNPNWGGGGDPSPKSGPKRRCWKGTSRAFCTLAFRSLFVLGMAPWGNLPPKGW